CHQELASISQNKSDYWKCLEKSIWTDSEVVKTYVYAILKIFEKDTWAQELIEQIYLNEEELKFVSQIKIPLQEFSTNVITRDSHGSELHDGDSVTLIKDLDVKGAGFTAKRGTLVKNIRLTENPEHIEGRVNGVGIVLVSKFLKKVIED